MISLILPYWDRKAAADRALAVIESAYPSLPLEVIVVDDGSPEPYTPPALDLNIRVIRLPEKAEPKSPANCWNVGVREAKGDLIGISCIEILHTNQVLGPMADELTRLGPDGYVLAAAWCPEMHEWHCHSTGRAAGAPALPTGFGRAFLGLLHRKLYERAGGWDEDYRDGAGYEDIDFALRLELAGAKPVIRDDLVVIHPKTGASIQWGAEKFARNKALLRQKWGSA